MQFHTIVQFFISLFSSQNKHFHVIHLSGYQIYHSIIQDEQIKLQDESFQKHL